MITRRMRNAICAFSVFGLLDSAYLTIAHYLNTNPACGIIEGCDKVTTGPYALWGQVPVAVIGLVYFLFLTIFSFQLLHRLSKKTFLALLLLSFLGALMAVRFIGLQIFVIKAICIYCVGVDFASIAIFSLLFLSRKNFKDPFPPMAENI